MSRELRTELVTGRRIAIALELVVNETPAGAPAGMLYLPLAPYISVENFNRMLCGLVAAKRISRFGDSYYPAGMVGGTA